MSGKIGIYGGSFDPVHHGHLITAGSVLEKRNLDKIILIPCHISPLKTEEHPVSGEHRLNMVKLAVEGNDRFEVSDYELRKGEVSFTYDTLLEFAEIYKHIELIIGFDNLLVFEKWKNPDEIFKIATVVVMKRIADQNVKSANRFFNKAILLDTPAVEISATDIRNRIKSDLPIDYLVPEKVKEYIYKNGLYK